MEDSISCIYCFLCDCAMFEHRRLVAQWVEVQNLEPANRCKRQYIARVCKGGFVCNRCTIHYFICISSNLFVAMTSIRKTYKNKKDFLEAMTEFEEQSKDKFRKI